MDISVLPRSAVMPWFRQNKDLDFWLDRAALISFAILPHIYLMQNHIWWDDVLSFFTEDIKKREEGYLYSFQNILAALIAFVSALIVYIAAHYNERKNSFVAVNNVRLLTNEIRGRIDFIADNIGQTNIAEDVIALCSGMKKYSEEISSFIDFLIRQQ